MNKKIKDELKKINFIKTADNSTGLYSEEYKDIFHSVTGALDEAYQKFVIPAQNLNTKSRLNILDVCYGIGYNTKAMLNNCDCNINIDALEFNPLYIFLSPLVKDCIDNLDLKLSVLEQICINFKNIEEICLIYKNILSNANNGFFDENIRAFIQFYTNDGYKYTPQVLTQGFLHNIYYDYISNNNLCPFKRNEYKKFDLRYFIGDARQTIAHTDKKYDFVFFDAFSPQKAPILWTIDFLTQIKNKIEENGIFLTYSKSTPVRSALLELGFCVGKTILNKKEIGTIASLNKDKITNPLTPYDLEIIKTTSGVPYRDKMLNLTNHKIIENRNIEMQKSGRISRTQFIKHHNEL